MNETARARPAEMRDVDALVELRAQMFMAMGVSGDSRWRVAARTWFRDRLSDPGYGIVVVEMAGEVVACAVGAVRDAAPSPAVPDGEDVLISNVCTVPAHRGRGFGRLAFEAVMEWARATGVARAELMATHAGRRMYESAGFQVVTHPAMRARLEQA